jgi:hypothetical protein
MYEVPFSFDYIVTTCDSKEVLASGTSKVYNDDGAKTSFQ